MAVKATNVNWIYGRLIFPITAWRADGAQQTLEPGTIVRLYSGTIPDAQIKGLGSSPDAQGQTLMELVPPPGGYWLSYTDTVPNAEQIDSAAYKADLPARVTRLFKGDVLAGDYDVVQDVGTGSEPGVADLDAVGAPGAKAFVNGKVVGWTGANGALIGLGLIAAAVAVWSSGRKA